MSEQIVKIETDPKDDACMLITLRHLPNRFNFWQRKAKIAVYKGHGQHWYRLPSFTPVPTKLLPLLKAISYGPQFKHLRYDLNRKTPQRVS